MAESDSPHCTVYFDGGCPICRREVAHYRTRSGADRIRWVDANTAEAYALGPDLDGRHALARFHVRQPYGRLVAGAAAFAALWKQLPAYAWAGRVAAWPPVLLLLEAGYRLFLRARPLWRRQGSSA
jgi:predicted DCC family thiol-disulfide oxidoreductase YuxK